MIEVHSAEDITALLTENGFVAAEEYFGNEIDPPYAVVLEPEAAVTAGDFGMIFGRKQKFSAELYVLTKKDPLCGLFRKVIYDNIPAPSFTEICESFGAGRGYMIAIEFEILI